MTNHPSQRRNLYLRGRGNRRTESLPVFPAGDRRLLGVLSGTEFLRRTQTCQPCHSSPEALESCGFSMEKLAVEGVDPAEAMQRFETWLQEVLPTGQSPIFVGFNAPFDWMFVNDYFHRFLGHNPFGHAAIDIKSYYMGLAKVPWEETTMQFLGRHVSEPAGADPSCPEGCP